MRSEFGCFCTNQSKLHWLQPILSRLRETLCCPVKATAKQKLRFSKSAYPSSQCAPGAGAQETACGPCSHGVAGNPISLASGDTYIEENDVNLPGLSGGLILQRTWNSLWPATQTAYQIEMFGPNWRSN